jgi:hypothetical protein
MNMILPAIPRALAAEAGEEESLVVLMEAVFG